MQTLKILKVGDEFDRQTLPSLLAELHYDQKALVAQPGEFALRGSVVDIYPLTYRSPVRLEFEADRLVSIRDFSPLDGKSLTAFEEVFLLPMTDIFRRKRSKLREQFENFEALTESRDLQAGDYVVHLEFGIGRFVGTKALQIKNVRKRRLAVEYADREILYFELEEPLERYIGGEGYAPKLTRLHTRDWERVKEKTRRAVAGIAHDLLEVQAKRSVERGLSFPPDNDWQRQFEAEFPFEETPDQLRAIEEVKKDLESVRPMDRLICGDVGYGKTEVAMRAAFKAVTAGKQVAILVPTTILAEQHYLVLKKRVSHFPVTVEVLSRYRSRQEQAKVLQATVRGSVDILIGTHRLLSRDVQFKDLGLIVIDEEQRFGVRHKERLKQYRAMVEVLTLTATPIPRTLYLSLMGVRDMSVINTPPQTRLAVETHVLEYSDEKIREALIREAARGGQSYFVHNRVESIEKIHTRLCQTVPDIKFGVAHGQMRAGELELVMKSFLEGRIDCLISTNIIESGIDIPNANTIIVNRADAFGLADLYQLRGRVGRYHEKRQAYAYLLVPKNWVLSRDAEKRLNAIERFTQLGSGFKIAMEDLEIRGAGNILGHEQSGFIHAVGFDLYCRMLRQAVKAAEQEPVSKKGQGLLQNPPECAIKTS